MGGGLDSSRASSDGPSFIVNALRDPGAEGIETTPLERVQIVKGWLDAQGESHVEVIDVAGEPSGATVDPQTCELVGEGEDQLCAVWRDPDFDPAQSAYYYVRVLENPSCRWSTRDCLELAASPPPEGLPKACTNGEHQQFIQERAWTSPIWYSATP